MTVTWWGSNMIDNIKLVRYDGKYLQPRDDLEFEILRDAESDRRKEEKAQNRRRDNIRELIRVLVILVFLPFTIFSLISWLFNLC